MQRAWVAAIALAAGGAAGAQTSPELAMEQGQPYKHAPSGLVIPAMLAGLPRTSARAFAADHLDEAFNYATPDVGEDITVFVFRNVSGSVPVWFDRVASAVEHREIYGTPGIASPAAAFAPPGQQRASGLIETWRPGKGRYRSTGVAFMPLGPDWYVELRYSSVTIDPAAMDARLRGVVAAIGWPGAIEPQPVAVPIADCATPLALKGRAKSLTKGKDVTASILLGAMTASLAGDRSPKKDGPAPAPARAWCRDTGSYGLPAQHGLYRPVGTTDQYLIALNDAGRGIWVAPNTLATLVAADHGKSSLSWSVAIDDIAAVTTFADRDRLPPPDQALEIVRAEPYASRTATWGPKRDVNINGALFK